RACLDQRVLLVRLARMLALDRFDHVHLATTRGERAQLAAYAEQDRFGDVPEVETDAAAVRAAVLPALRPNEHRLVLEPPRLHDLQALGHQGVRNPQVAMRLGGHHVGDGKRRDLLPVHRLVAVQPLVLRGNLASPVHEPPGRIGQHGAERSSGELVELGHGWCQAPAGKTASVMTIWKVRITDWPVASNVASTSTE